MLKQTKNLKFISEEAPKKTLMVIYWYCGAFFFLAHIRLRHSTTNNYCVHVCFYLIIVAVVDINAVYEIERFVSFYPCLCKYSV